MTFAAIFALVVGVGMLTQWTLSFVTKQIPELRTEPIRIAFHLAGEAITALLLVVGGLGLLAAVPWARTVFLISVGMLLYTAIVSPGYFAQRGKWGWLIMFTALIVLALATVIALSTSATV